jgi:hypothetical protein
MNASTAAAAATPPGRRQQLADDLQWLADHRLTDDPRPVAEQRRAELVELERDVFEPVFRPALMFSGRRRRSLRSA